MDYWLQELNKETSILDKIRNAYINNKELESPENAVRILWKANKLLLLSYL